MPAIDYRANQAMPIRAGDSVAMSPDGRGAVYQNPEVVPLPSASYLAVYLSASERWILPPTGWNGQ